MIIENKENLENGYRLDEPKETNDKMGYGALDGVEGRKEDIRGKLVKSK